jgi:hypothetical protein
MIFKYNIWMNTMSRNIVIAAIMAVGIAGLVYAQKQASLPAPVPGEAATSTAGSLVDQVAAHNTRESCWTIINGSVYDLTSWVPKHPGGEQAILGLCGTDGSTRFNGKHGGSSRHQIILAGFRIDPAGGVVAPGTPAAGAPQVAPATIGTDDDGTGDSGRGRGRGGDDN